MRCRRIQWTIYNILMYYNYASIFSYCLSGTEFRHTLMRTIQMKTRASFVSMFNTDVNNINQRRISTPQHSNRLLVEYSAKQRFRSLSVSLMPTIKKTNPITTSRAKVSSHQYLNVQTQDYHSHHRRSCVMDSNRPDLKSLKIQQNGLQQTWRSAYLSTNVDDPDKKTSKTTENKIIHGQ